MYFIIDGWAGGQITLRIALDQQFPVNGSLHSSSLESGCPIHVANRNGKN